jgi:hypothetical protein
MMIIKCVRCRQKIYKYVKIGKGKLWHCWKDRILEDLSIHDGKIIKCSCGNIIGLEENRRIKLKQHSILISGTKTG